MAEVVAGSSFSGGVLSGAYVSILKEYYSDQHVENMVYKNNPLYALMPKDENFGGKYHPVPIQYGDNMSRSHDFDKAQTKSKTQTAKYESFFIDSVENYQIARISTKSILQSKGDVAAFLPIATKEMDSAINNLTRDLAVGMYRSGYGERGQIKVGSIVAGQSVIYLENPSDITNFEVGMELVLSTALSSAALKATAVANVNPMVIAVNRRVGSESITLGTTVSTTAVAIDTTIVTAAAGDYLFIDGDRQNSATPDFTKLCGLASWVPYTAPTAGVKFWNVDRSVDSRLYGQSVDGTGMPIEEVLEDLDALVCREGGDPDYAFMNPLDYRDFKKAVGSRAILVNVKANATVGFQGIEMASQKGTIKIIPDQNCPAGLIYLLQLDTFKLYSMGKAVRTLDLDGLQMLRIGNADGIEIRYASYSQVGCRAPGWNGVAKLK
jgi:hypothetical protein